MTWLEDVRARSAELGKALPIDDDIGVIDPGHRAHPRRSTTLSRN